MNPCTSKSKISPKKRGLKRKRHSTPPKIKEMIQGLGLDSSRSFCSSNNHTHSNSHSHSNSHTHSNTHTHSNSHTHSNNLKSPSESYMESLRLTPEADNEKHRKKRKC